jgi:hypothetical protein
LIYSINTIKELRLTYLFRQPLAYVFNFDVHPDGSISGIEQISNVEVSAKYSGMFKTRKINLLCDCRDGTVLRYTGTYSPLNDSNSSTPQFEVKLGNLKYYQYPLRMPFDLL